MTRIALSVLLAFASTPAFACDAEGMLFTLMDMPLDGQPSYSFDVAEVGSTEGGDWQVWLAPDGKTVRNLVRTDYGEGGRRATRLVVAAPGAYAVTDTDYVYSAPNYIEGSITIREEKDIYVFCDGKLLLPKGDFGPDPAYAAGAKEALATFDAAEVKQYMPGLKR